MGEGGPDSPAEHLKAFLWRFLCAGEHYEPGQDYLGTVATTKGNNCCLDRCCCCAVVLQCWWCCCVCPSQHALFEEFPMFLDGIIEPDRWAKAVKEMNRALIPVFTFEKYEALFYFVVCVIGIKGAQVYFGVIIAKRGRMGIPVLVLWDLGFLFFWITMSRLRAWLARRRMERIDAKYFEPFGVRMRYRSRIAEADTHKACSGCTFQMKAFEYLAGGDDADTADAEAGAAEAFGSFGGNGIEHTTHLSHDDVEAADDTSHWSTLQQSSNTTAWGMVTLVEALKDPAKTQVAVEQVLAEGSVAQKEALAVSLNIPVDCLQHMARGAPRVLPPNPAQQKAQSWVDQQLESHAVLKHQAKKKADWQANFSKRKADLEKQQKEKNFQKQKQARLMALEEAGVNAGPAGHGKHHVV
jgi:hypothetical protein